MAVSYLLICWGFLNVIQIVYLFFAAKKHDVIIKNSPKVTISYLDDYFFIAWNSFCSIICIYYVYFLQLDSENLVRSTFEGSPLKEGLFGFIYLFVSFVDKFNIEFLFYGLFVYLGIRTQFKNIDRQTEYWWLEKYCKICWAVRILFLVINIFVVAYISWRISVFLSEVLYLLSEGSKLKFSVFDQDGHSGLSKLGHALVITISIFSIRFFIGILGLYDHTRVRKINVVYILGDIYNVAYGIISIVIFLLFTYFMHITISPVKTSIIDDIDKKCNLDNFTNFGSISCTDSQLIVREIVMSVKTIPFSFQDIGFILLAWTLPLMIGICLKETEKRVL